LTNRTIKTLNGQLNRNAKFDVFEHLKRNAGVLSKSIIQVFKILNNLLIYTYILVNFNNQNLIIK
jgi:hypothetical protein